MKFDINYFTTFLKGFLMGTCDVIPGVSGGTIAFITGIYEKLIRSIKNITTKDFIQMKLSFLKGDFRTFKYLFFKLEMDFLGTLLIGILSALFFISKLVLFLLENFRTYTLMFFIGLILASTIFIFNEIRNHNLSNYISGLLGLVVGISLLFLNTHNVTDVNLYYICFGGFIAVSAMFLPGISGSFILLVLGIYDIIYNSIHNMSNEWEILLSFGIGVILGAVFISKLIDFLFKWNKSKTLYFLLGLVAGALLIPLREVYSATTIFTIINLILLLCFTIEGILIITLVNILSKKKNY